MLIEIKSNSSLYDIVSQYPDVKEIMVELGFHDILKPGMLQTAGRVMTIQKGSRLKNIDWTIVQKIFKDHGYLVIKENYRE